MSETISEAIKNSLAVQAESEKLMNRVKAENKTVDQVFIQHGLDPVEMRTMLAEFDNDEVLAEIEAARKKIDEEIQAEARRLRSELSINSVDGPSQPVKRFKPMV